MTTRVGKKVPITIALAICVAICLAPFGIAASGESGSDLGAPNRTQFAQMGDAPISIAPMRAYAASWSDDQAGELREARFGPSQVYDGTLYVGNLRTNQGDKAVTSIPGSVTPSPSAERFLFSDGYYYYVEDFPGNGSGAVKLHRANMRSGDDIVLADDVFSGTDVFYADGEIAYTPFSDESAVTVVDVKTGAKQNIDFGSPKGLCRLIGYHEKNAYISVALYGSQTVIYHRSASDPEPYVVMRLDTGEEVAGLFEGALVTVNGTLVEVSDEGGPRWSCELEQHPVANRFLCSGGYLFFDTSAKVDDSSKHVGRISLADGSKEEHATGLPVIFRVMHADKIGIYFCATEDNSTKSLMGGSFNTYCCSIASGIISNMDELD